MKNGMIVDEYGNKFWFLNDKLHREDGPTVEGADGTKRWYLNGKLHREDGPAIVWSDGTKWWYFNGERLSKEQWLDAMTNILLDRI